MHTLSHNRRAQHLPQIITYSGQSTGFWPFQDTLDCFTVSGRMSRAYRSPITVPEPAENPEFWARKPIYLRSRQLTLTLCMKNRVRRRRRFIFVLCSRSILKWLRNFAYSRVALVKSARTVPRMLCEWCGPMVNGSVTRRM